MATVVKKGTHARRRPRDPAKEINRAVLRLLKAIPVDHLDKRLTAVEKWLGRLQKDLGKMIREAGRPEPRPRKTATARRRTTTTARRRPAVRRAAVRHISHLPVEREMVHPGG